MTDGQRRREIDGENDDGNDDMDDVAAPRGGIIVADADRVERTNIPARASDASGEAARAAIDAAARIRGTVDDATRLIANVGVAIGNQDAACIDWAPDPDGADPRPGFRIVVLPDPTDPDAAPGAGRPIDVRVFQARHGGETPRAQAGSEPAPPARTMPTDERPAAEGDELRARAAEGLLKLLPEYADEIRDALLTRPGEAVGHA